MRMKSWATLGLFALSLSIASFGIFCAEVESGGWGDNPDPGGDGGPKPPEGDMAWHCFTGTAATEEQLLDHCTEAERVDRVSNIPVTTWDPKDPLP